MITKLLSNFHAHGKTALLDLFYPPICVTCQEKLQVNEDTICLSCLLDLPFTESHLSPLLALDEKFLGRLPVHSIYTWVRFAKKTKIQSLLHALKYHQKPDLARVVGMHYGSLLRHQIDLQTYDALIPIPMHPRKKALRGYNQAEEFAWGLGQSTGIPVRTDVIQKRKFTQSQTNFTKQNRFQNLQGSFAILYPEYVKGKKIALVDDVLTTGATLEEAGNILVQSGVSELSIITIATAF
ncbi:MAG: ComF family protein [Spirosomataceae bacterium]